MPQIVNETNTEPTVQSFTAEAELTPKDMRRARFFDLLWRRKWFLGYVIVFSLLSLAFLGVHYGGYYTIPAAGLIIAILFLLLEVGGLLYIVAASNGYKRRKFTFSPGALSTPAGLDNRILTFRWDKFFNVYETKNYIYFYLDVTQFLIMPKRCLAEEEYRLIKQYLAGAKDCKYHVK